ncbi:MAG: hypothetical protein HQL69_03325 [Magnetococcales bacterium]|nr:hypothetical protein [Magnetococcales bacterium]
MIIFGGFSAIRLITPSNDELALIYLKAGQYTDAQKYVDRIMEDSDPTVKNLMPLLELRIRHGSIEDAINLLEKLVENNPNLLEARQLLGLYYKLAQRPFDELHNQEEIRKIRPTVELLEKLVVSYDLLAMYPQEIDVLYQLVREYPEKPDNFIKLAILLASRKQWIEAADVLLILRKRHPDVMDSQLAILHTDMLLMVGENEKALMASKSWLTNHFDPYHASVFGDLLHYSANAELAWRLLEPYQGAALHSADLLTKWIELADATGRQDAVMPIIERQFEKGKLAIKVLPQLVAMALKQENNELAIKVVNALPDKAFPPWLKHLFIDYAIDKGEVKTAEFLTKRLDVDFLNDNPVKTASLTWLLGNKVNTTFWLDRAWSNEKIKIEHLQSGIALLLEMGEKQTAMAWAQRAVANPNSPSWLIADLRQYFFDNGRYSDGFIVFDNLYKSRKGMEVEKGWVLFSALEGKNQSAIIHWIKNLKESEYGFLKDLTYGAFNGGNTNIALVGAKIINKHYQNRESRLLLAEIYVLAGQLQKAMKIAKILADSQNSEDRLIYGSIVRQSWEKNLAVSDIMLDLANKSLNNPKLYGLAQNYGELGYLALDLGDQSLAEKSFLIAAKNITSPKNPIVGQLRYLWGPKAPKEAVSWLLVRAKKSSNENITGWMEHLLNSGQPQLVVDIGMKRLELLGKNHRFSDLIQEASLRLDNKAMVAELMLRQIPFVQKDIKRLMTISRAALDLDLKNTASIIMKTLLKSDPKNTFALKNLGIFAMEQKRWQAAERYFQRLLVQPKATHQDYLYMGDVLINKGAKERGEMYLRAALDMLETSQTYKERSTKARLLHRLGMKKKAMNQYAQLLHEKKDDHWLRADYVELLFEMDRLDLAQQLLN